MAVIMKIETTVPVDKWIPVQKGLSNLPDGIIREIVKYF